MFLVITGPSGVGKTTIIENLLKNPLFALSVSATTRSPRPGEVNGKHYEFITKEEFERRIKEKKFIEYAIFSGNYYGTLLFDRKPGVITIFDLQIGGVEFFFREKIGAYFCMITSSRDTIIERLNKRNVSKEEFEERIKSFNMYSGVEKSMFNKVIHNSGSLDDLAAEIEDLKKNILEFYKNDIDKVYKN